MLAILTKPVLTTLLAVGTLYTVYLTLRLLKFIHIHFLRRSSLPLYLHTLPHHTSTDSPWAIITGSTDGIGKAYAFALASANFNIVLHGRNPQKLHHVRHELQTEFPHLQFKILLLDAGVARNEDIERAIKELGDIHITILINNVGTGSQNDGPTMQSFTQNTTSDIDTLLNINARFPLQFTRAVLPRLLSHRGPALVIIMGSLSEIGIPYMTTYVASKTPDLGFARALRRDLIAMGRRDVEVLGVMTGAVAGVSWDRRQGGVFRPGAGEFARAALGKVGCGEVVVAGWWSHGVLWEVFEVLPLWIVDWVMLWGSRSAMRRINERWEKEHGEKSG